MNLIQNSALIIRLWWLLYGEMWEPSTCLLHVFLHSPPYDWK